jgi:hypothetical protein
MYKNKKIPSECTQLFYRNFIALEHASYRYVMGYFYQLSKLKIRKKTVWSLINCPGFNMNTWSDLYRNWFDIHETYYMVSGHHTLLTCYKSTTSIEHTGAGQFAFSRHWWCNHQAWNILYRFHFSIGQCWLIRNWTMLTQLDSEQCISRTSSHFCTFQTTRFL